MAKGTDGIDEGNLRIQQQINAVLTERARIMSNLNESLTKNNELLNSLVAAQEGLRRQSGSSTEQMTQSVAVLDAYLASQEQSKQKTEELNKAIRAQAKAAKEAANNFALLKSAMKIAGATIKGFVGGAMSAIGVIADLASGLFNLGMTILTSPLKMLDGLINMANKLPSGVNPILEAMEEIKKSFGDLSKNEGAAVAGTLGELRAESSNLAGTGMSVRKVFGYGPEGLAAGMKFVNEIATALGGSFSSLSEKFDENRTKLIVFTKGFTGSAEATAAYMKHATSMGENFIDYMTRATELAQKMGRVYGINSKVIGKSVSQMMTDISNFGALSVKEMTAAAVYANKLGIEVKDLGDVMNKFLNFEDAAKGAAEMAQAFGMNVDVLELMKGGPQAIDEMRRSFFAAGNSLSGMTTAERKYFEQLTQLQGASLEAAFASDKQSESYEKISESANDAAATQTSQQKVMQELGKSIERVFSSGTRTFDSFFDSFSQGFTDGFMRAKPMYDLLRNIRIALKEVYWEARSIGKEFVNSFPGLKEFLEGLANIFSRENISGLMKDVHGAFTTLFSDLAGDNRQSAVGIFLTNIKEAFASLFARNSSSIKSIKDGGGTLLSTVGEIFTQLAIIALEGLTTVFETIETFMKNGMTLQGTDLGKIFDRLVSAIAGAIMPIVERLRPYVEKAVAALVSMITSSLEAIWNADAGAKGASFGQKITSWLKDAVLYAALAGGAIALIGGALAVLGGVFSTMIVAAITKNLEKKALQKAGEGVVQTLTEVATTASDGKGPAGAMSGAGSIADTAAAGPKKGVFMDAAKKIGGYAIFMTVLAAAAPFIIAGISKLAKLAGITDEDFKISLKILGFMGLLIAAGAGVAYVLKTVPNMPPAIATKGLATIAAVIIGLGALTVAFLGIVSLISSDLKPELVKAVSDTMGQMTLSGIAITYAAIGIGALIASSLGIGIGVIVAGVAMIAVVITELIRKLVPVMEELSKIRIQDPESFKIASDAMIRMLEISSDLASSVAKILDSMPSGGFFTSNEEKQKIFTQNITKVTELIKAITKPVESIGTTVETMMKSLDGKSPELLKSAATFFESVFGPMLEITGRISSLFSEIISSSTNPDTKEFNILLMMDIVEQAKKIIDMLTAMMTYDMPKIVNDLLKIVSQFTFTDDFESKASKVTTIFGIIGSFSDIIKSFIDMSKEKMPEDPNALMSVAQDAVGLDGIFKAIDTITTVINTGMSSVIGKIFELVNLPAFADKSLVNRIPILSSMFDAIKTLTESITSLSGAGGEAAEKGLRSLDGLLTLRSAHTSMGYAPEGSNLLTSIVYSFGHLADDVNIIVGAARMKTVKDFFDSLKSVSESMTSIASVPGSAGTKLAELDTNLKSITQKNGLLSALEGSDLGGRLGVVKTNATLMATTMSEVNKIANLMIPTNINAIAGGANKISAALVAYEESVQSIVDLDKKIQDSKAFELAVQIGEQLKADKSIAVEIKPATFNVNVSVNVDAEEFIKSLTKTEPLKEALRKSINVATQ